MLEYDSDGISVGWVLGFGSVAAVGAARLLLLENLVVVDPCVAACELWQMT